MTNWAEIRKQFPVTERVAYLNTAAAGPLAVSVAEAGSEYYRQMMVDGDMALAQREALHTSTLGAQVTPAGSARDVAARAADARGL